MNKQPFPHRAAADVPYYLRERRQLLALVPPLSQQIIDGVAAIGPCTVAELAALVGSKPTALYHHLARLEKVGLLLRADGDSGKRGRPRSRYDVRGRPVLLDIAALSTTARGQLEKYVAAMLRNAFRGYSRGLKSRHVVHSGPRRNLWAASWKGWLNDAEVERAGALLQSLISLLQGGTASGQKGRRLLELTFVIAPTVER